MDIGKGGFEFRKAANCLPESLIILPESVVA